MCSQKNVRTIYSLRIEWSVKCDTREKTKFHALSPSKEI